MYYEGGVIFVFSGFFVLMLYILFESCMGGEIVSFICCWFWEYECVVNGELVRVSLIMFCIGFGIDICILKGVL